MTPIVAENRDQLPLFVIAFIIQCASIFRAYVLIDQVLDL